MMYLTLLLELSFLLLIAGIFTQILVIFLILKGEADIALIDFVIVLFLLCQFLFPATK